MKKHDEMSDRELLIRIDERTAILPELKNKVEKHDFAIITIAVVMLVSTKYQWIADALAKAFG
jgi:hypothetical protein